jgi:arylsulfatase A-like enzyme
MKESEATRKLYGIDKPQTRDFGTRLLLARRLVERGVRFVQVYSGGGPVSIQWDAHSNLVANHEKMAGLTDQPIAALLQDLKARGLLDDTLVIWGSEFGRLPMSESGNGRDHNPHGYTMWFAGGGAKGGTVVGETDELGLRGVGERYHMRDFHATMLHMMGLDQHKLFYLHNGRNEKLTDFGGNLITKLYS